MPRFRKRGSDTAYLRKSCLTMSSVSVKGKVSEVPPRENLYAKGRFWKCSGSQKSPRSSTAILALRSLSNTCTSAQFVYIAEGSKHVSVLLMLHDMLHGSLLNKSPWFQQLVAQSRRWYVMCHVPSMYADLDKANISCCVSFKDIVLSAGDLPASQMPELWGRSRRLCNPNCRHPAEPPSHSHRQSIFPP